MMLLSATTYIPFAGIETFGVSLKVLDVVYTKKLSQTFVMIRFFDC
jgi:hypothetical protein